MTFENRSPSGTNSGVIAERLIQQYVSHVSLASWQYELNEFFLPPRHGCKSFGGLWGADLPVFR